MNILFGMIILKKSPNHNLFIETCMVKQTAFCYNLKYPRAESTLRYIFRYVFWKAFVRKDHIRTKFAFCSFSNNEPSVPDWMKPTVWTGLTAQSYSFSVKSAANRATCLSRISEIKAQCKSALWVLAVCRTVNTQWQICWDGRTLQSDLITNI